VERGFNDAYKNYRMLESLKELGMLGNGIEGI